MPVCQGTAAEFAGGHQSGPHEVDVAFSVLVSEGIASVYIHAESSWKRSGASAVTSVKSGIHQECLRCTDQQYHRWRVSTQDVPVPTLPVPALDGRVCASIRVSSKSGRARLRSVRLSFC